MGDAMYKCTLTAQGWPIWQGLSLALPAPWGVPIQIITPLPSQVVTPRNVLVSLLPPGLVGETAALSPRRLRVSGDVTGPACSRMPENLSGRRHSAFFPPKAAWDTVTLTKRRCVQVCSFVCILNV